MVVSVFWYDKRYDLKYVEAFFATAKGLRFWHFEHIVESAQIFGKQKILRAYNQLKAWEIDVM